MNTPIGILDSGIGGLSVLTEINSVLPEEKIIYFGDTANLPYGNKTPAQIQKFVFDILKFFKQKKVKAVVMACNTSSALVLDKARPCFDFPIIGVIEPAVREALKVIRTSQVALFANAATIESGVYDKIMKKYSDNKISVVGKACPYFVSFVESGIFSGAEVDRVVKRYLSAFDNVNADTLILGCTHYPFLEPAIKKADAGRFKLINPAHATALELADILKDKNLENLSGLTPDYKFYVTAQPEKFTETASQLLNKKIDQAYLINPRFSLQEA